MKTIRANAVDHFIGNRKALTAALCGVMILAGFLSLLSGFKTLRAERALSRAKSPQAWRKIAENADYAGTAIGVSAALKMGNFFFLKKNYPEAEKAFRLLDSWKLDANSRAEVKESLLLLLKLQGRDQEALAEAKALLDDASMPPKVRIVAAIAGSEILMAGEGSAQAKPLLDKALAIPFPASDLEAQEAKGEAAALLSLSVSRGNQAEARK